jgi:RNA polymerase sigma factor (TIGR02999 family)
MHLYLSEREKIGSITSKFDAFDADLSYHRPVTEGEPITELLEAAGRGSKLSEQKLFDLVYGELHKLAQSSMRREARPGVTLQASALVNEAYLRLVGERPIRWESRAHFYVTAARTMRRILIDHSRQRQAAKRDAGLRVEWEHADLAASPEGPGLLEMDQALDRLAELDPRQARVVELRFFAGLSVEEAAEVMGISPKTVKREWAFARAWLESELTRLPPCHQNNGID